MILKILVQLCTISPWFRKLVWHRWYQYLAGYQKQDWQFMNYGYVSIANDEPSLQLRPADEGDRLSIQLYHFVVGNMKLADMQVLEVGSGRGGGASFIASYHQPKMMTGVDFAGKAVSACQKNYDQPNLRFLKGNAEDLPFDDQQFDFVINVESSHCYGSIASFFEQVHRVLRTGGCFLFADFRPSDEIKLLEQQFQNAGLTILEKTDITPDVLEAMRLDNDRKLKLIDELAGNRLNGTLRQFAGIEDSEIYEGFRSGAMMYVHFKLKKSSE